MIKANYFKFLRPVKSKFNKIKTQVPLNYPAISSAKKLEKN